MYVFRATLVFKALPVVTMKFVELDESAVYRAIGTVFREGDYFSFEGVVKKKIYHDYAQKVQI